MNKVISIQEAVDMIPDGASIMIGGFVGCGSPHALLDALSKSGKGNFTVICNDGAKANGPDGEEFYATAKLIHNHQIKKLIASHVGLNPEIAEQMHAGTIIEENEFCLGRQTVQGRDYLLMAPLHADFALVNAFEVDHSGNMVYHGSSRNFNTVMATAADTVIAEGDNVVGNGDLSPDSVVTPGVYVNYVVQGGVR